MSHHMNALDRILNRRAEDRRRIALDRTQRVLESAKGEGIPITLIGSLAKGAFRVHSDVDFFVHGATDPSRRVAVERLVAAAFRGTGIPYDIIYASDLTQERVREFLDV